MACCWGNNIRVSWETNLAASRAARHPFPGRPLWTRIVYLSDILRRELGKERVECLNIRAGERAAAEVDGALEATRHEHFARAVDADRMAPVAARPPKALAPQGVAGRILQLNWLPCGGGPLRRSQQATASSQLHRADALGA